MTTAVVVATVVTTNVSENEFRSRALDQIRHNDRSLLDRLTAAGIDARVVTAIMDVDEFIDYVRERDQRDHQNPASAESNGHAQHDEAAPDAVEPDEFKTTVVTENMSEAEFMDYTLQQLRNGQQSALVEFSAEELSDMEDEEIGEHFSRYPFQY